MSPLVIDASVAIKWVVQEAGTDEATALRGAHALVAPDLIVAECANVLWKKVNRREFLAEEAVLAARLLASAEIELVPMRGMLEEATRLAVELDHPAYDCLYLALAVGRGTCLATADERLIGRVRSSPSVLAPQIVVSLQEAVRLTS